MRHLYGPGVGQDAHGRRGRCAGAGGEHRGDAEDVGERGTEGDGVVLYVYGEDGAVVGAEVECVHII